MYAPPAAAHGRPAVILAFRVYALGTVALYDGLALLWALFLPANRTSMGEHSWLPAIAIGLWSLALTAFYVRAALVPYKPWGWTFGLVAICFGLASCFVIVAVPLLVYWLKPETKAAFGRF